MRRYKEVRRGSRGFIIPEDSRLDRITVQPDPTSETVRLLWLMDCPLGLRQACIRVDGRNITSFCKHMGPYPDRNNGAPTLDRVRCRYPEANKTLKVQFLTAFAECSKGGFCITPGSKCEALQDVSPAPGIDFSKPHFAILCDQGPNIYLT
jgi:hypothetical protein